MKPGQREFLISLHVSFSANLKAVHVNAWTEIFYVRSQFHDCEIRRSWLLYFIGKNWPSHQHWCEVKYKTHAGTFLSLPGFPLERRPALDTSWPFYAQLSLALFFIQFPLSLSRWRVSTQNAKTWANKKVRAFKWKSLSPSLFCLVWIFFLFFVFCTPLDALSVFHFHPFHSFFSLADPLFIFMAHQWPIQLFSALPGSLLLLCSVLTFLSSLSPPASWNHLSARPFPLTCTQVASQFFTITSGLCFIFMYVDGGGGGGFRQATNAPRAIFKSHFTLLRVKRPDTALCEGRRKKREERKGTRGWEWEE